MAKKQGTELSGGAMTEVGSLMMFLQFDYEASPWRHRVRHWCCKIWSQTCAKWSSQEPLGWSGVNEQSIVSKEWRPLGEDHVESSKLDMTYSTGMNNYTKPLPLQLSYWLWFSCTLILTWLYKFILCSKKRQWHIPYEPNWDEGDPTTKTPLIQYSPVLTGLTPISDDTGLARSSSFSHFTQQFWEQHQATTCSPGLPAQDYCPRQMELHAL